MRENILYQSFYYLNKMLNKKQKRFALGLLVLMFIGMTAEILLLNNLMILLNYLTNTSLDTPKIVEYFSQFFKETKTIILVLLLFIITFLIKTNMNILVKWKESKFLYSLKAEVSEHLFIGYLKLPFIFHQRTNSAKILKNITLEIEQFAIFVYSISKLLLEFIVLTGISLYLMYINFFISLTCILSFILFGYLFNYFNKGKIKEMGTNRLIHQDKRMQSLTEGIGSIRETILSSKNENIVNSFILHNNSISKISISMSLRNAFSKPAFEIFMLILLSLFIFYFISINALQASLIPIIGIYLAAAYRLVPSIAIIVQSIQEIQFNIKSVKNLHNDVSKFDKNLDLKENPNLKISFDKNIKIDNLSFAYDIPEQNRKNIIFDKINLEIKKGDFVGITGESGCGKSTLIDLLVGLHTSNKGSILVDGVSINENIKSWQKLIGCVPQEVFISDSSLKKNIAFGEINEKISKVKVERALKFSNLYLLSNSLENGVDTIIGEKGSRLSGGQNKELE